MSKSFDEIKTIIKNHKDELREKYGVRRIGIFGSIVRGEAREDSDVDILVEFEEGKATFDNFLGLVEHLERLLGKKIDLLTIDGVRSIRIDYIREEIEESVIYV
ncbi:nucleotidyltransferase family protein [bacterium]|nr:nucleotidyltransferase family protein [bacterium]